MKNNISLNPFNILKACQSITKIDLRKHDLPMAKICIVKLKTTLAKYNFFKCYDPRAK